MKQDTITKATSKAIQKPLEFRQSVMEQSKRLRHPAPKVAKIGATIGRSIGVGLVLIGCVHLFMGKSLWAIGALLTGTITIISNVLCHFRRNK